MPICKRVRRFLDDWGIRYAVVPHLEAFTAQEVAATSHVAGSHLAKVVVVRDPAGMLLMTVLPAPCRLDLAALARVAGRPRLSLVAEEEFARAFADCEPGAMPPFGNLYGMPVFLGSCFPRRGEFAFQAGNHHEIVKMRYEDYEELVCPVVGDFCDHAAHPEARREVRPAGARVHA